MSQKVKITLVVVAALLVLYALLAFDVPYRNKIDDFATCAAAGNPVMESYPRQCRDAKTGNTFVEEIPSSATTSMLKIDFPLQNSGISSPGHFSGKARGGWFFEGVFPIEVIGGDGKVLGRGVAKAQGEWTTNEFVPWLASIEFNAKGESAGQVKFMKDNPSGIPENDASVSVPVRFSQSTTLKECRPTGCSSQICSDQDVVSTCIYRPEYACYKSARCERQASGQCGWTETPELKLCLSQSK